MTPQEKAKELVDKFYQYLPIERDVTTSEGELSWKYDGWENAKECALIAIDEIIKALEEHQWQNRHVIEDYKLVKKELESYE